MHGAKAAVVLLLVLFLTPLHAKSVAPTIYEQKDMGDESVLRQLTYSISVDCTAAAINLIVMDDHNQPLGGADTYLRYVDFSTPLIAQGKTDKNGFILEKLPGSTLLMRGLFILVMEKNGFLNKEIHFDISGCYSNGTATPAPKAPANSTVPNSTQTNGTAAQPYNYTPAPPANASGAADNATASLISGLSLNSTGVAILGIVVLGLAVISIMVLKLIRKMQVRKKGKDGKT
jgi:hypothetical protein